MISRRNFLKGLLSGVAAVGLSPYIPAGIVPLKSVALKPATIKPFTAGEYIHAGNAVYIGSDGLYYNAVMDQFVGIALNSGRAYIDPIKVMTRGTVQLGAMPDKSYYLKAGE